VTCSLQQDVAAIPRGRGRGCVDRLDRCRAPERAFHRCGRPCTGLSGIRVSGCQCVSLNGRRSLAWPEHAPLEHCSLCTRPLYVVRFECSVERPRRCNWDCSTLLIFACHNPTRSYPALAPNLDRLASQSVQFQQAHVSVAVCSPSRTAFLTGLRPDTTQVWTIGPYFRNTSRGNGMRVVTLPQLFRQNGCVCAPWLCARACVHLLVYLLGFDFDCSALTALCDCAMRRCVQHHAV
jgi:hypothetical protein